MSIESTLFIFKCVFFLLQNKEKIIFLKKNKCPKKFKERRSHLLPRFFVVNILPAWRKHVRWNQKYYSKLKNDMLPSIMQEKSRGKNGWRCHRVDWNILHSPEIGTYPSYMQGAGQESICTAILRTNFQLKQYPYCLDCC